MSGARWLDCLARSQNQRSDAVGCCCVSQVWSNFSSIISRFNYCDLRKLLPFFGDNNVCVSHPWSLLCRWHLCVFSYSTTEFLGVFFKASRAEKCRLLQPVCDSPELPSLEEYRNLLRGVVEKWESGFVKHSFVFSSCTSHLVKSWISNIRWDNDTSMNWFSNYFRPIFTFSFFKFRRGSCACDIYLWVLFLTYSFIFNVACLFCSGGWLSLLLGTRKDV